MGGHFSQPGRWIVGVVAVTAMLCWNQDLRAQPPSDSARADGAADAGAQQAAGDVPDDRDGMGMAGDAAEMREMARSMKSMADMCRMMMEREQQYRPYVMAAGGIVGAALVLALLLFVALEIQCIRYLAVRIKAERRKVL